MKRTLVFAAALVGLACSGGGRPGGGGGTAGTGTGSGGSTVGNAAGSEAIGGGSSGAGGPGSSYPGTGGTTRAALGGSATAGSSASAGGSTGGGGATTVATGPITIDPVTAAADLAKYYGDTGNVNTSGGSEAFVMHAGNNEVAYNTAVNCWVPNQTLNGAAGGCLEIIGNQAGQLIENAFFHHNYCERSVGLFEACAGNFKCHFREARHLDATP
jgi:hypothetical protein